MPWVRISSSINQHCWNISFSTLQLENPLNILHSLYEYHQITFQRTQWILLKNNMQKVKYIACDNRTITSCFPHWLLWNLDTETAGLRCKFLSQTLENVNSGNISKTSLPDEKLEPQTIAPHRYALWWVTFLNISTVHGFKILTIRFPQATFSTLPLPVVTNT